MKQKVRKPESLKTRKLEKVKGWETVVFGWILLGLGGDTIVNIEKARVMLKYLKKEWMQSIKEKIKNKTNKLMYKYGCEECEKNYKLVDDLLKIIEEI